MAAKKKTATTTKKKTTVSGAKRQGAAAAQRNDDNWQQVVKNRYPALAFYLDRPDIFGNEIAEILKTAVKEKWWKNKDSGFTKLNSAIRNTTYYKTTSSNAREFDQLTPPDQDAKITEYRTEVVKYIGGVNLSQDAITEISRSSARLGLTGEALSNYVYSRALTKTGAGDAYQYGQAAGMILAGGKAEELKADARAYFSSLSDTEIEQYLTGQKTRDDFRNMFKTRAKGQFAHLSQQLDANLTLEDIAKDYQSVAANVLEKPLTAIDMTDPKFMESIATRDESGNYRQMTIGEWAEKVKSDKRYGYQYTKTANDEARQIARSIARAFGGTYG